MNDDKLRQNKWPLLQYSAMKDTIGTVHLWTQIVGKIRLKKMPWVNHAWHVTLYVSSNGLTTHAVPYENGIFEINFDFINHQLLICTSEGTNEKVELYPRSVASFYKELTDKLRTLNIDVKIYAKPNEVDPAIPFAEDEVHKSYDKEQMHLLWLALVKVSNVFTQFRSMFSGKSSTVHFFWGSFDLAVTRFSGRTAPKYPGGAPNIPLDVMQESYSHEVSSAGFWPGNDAFPEAYFYSYCYPTPTDFSEQEVQPKETFFSKDLGEFLLPYNAVAQSDNPEQMLMKFLQSTYDAAASTGNWDTKSFEFTFRH